MPSKKFWIVAASVILISFADSYANSPFNFLRFIGNARSAGLSNTSTTLIEDPASAFFNPATAAVRGKKNFSVTFLKHVLDINSGTLAYQYALGENETVSALAAFTSYGSFDYADNNGVKNGTFGANDLSLGASYSNIIDSNLYYGATVKFLFFTLDKYNTTALAVDAGLLYRLADKRTNVGVSILNAGFQMTKLGSITENPPLDIRIGINHRLKGLPLLVNFGFHHLADEQESFFERFKNFTLGGELYIGKYLQLRAGYENQIRSDVGTKNNKGFTGISAGVGLRFQSFNFDYGFTSYGSAANLHRFTIDTEL